MSKLINVKTLRKDMASLIKRVRKGDRFTVLYRSRPAFQIVPVDDVGLELGALEDDPVYEAEAVGRSKDGVTAADHDAILYGAPPGR
jgi:prevent-host-death family protein